MTKASARGTVAVGFAVFVQGAVLSSSCTYDPAFPACQIPCDDTTLCPSGLTCTAGLCGTGCGASAGHGGSAGRGGGSAGGDSGGRGGGAGGAGGGAAGAAGAPGPQGWAAAWTGLEGGVVNALVIAPAHPATVYAGTRGGVWKSTDASRTAWRPSSAGLPRSGILSLAIDPVQTNILYAGTETAGIYKTTDGGATWSSLNAGGPPKMATTGFPALAVHPSHPSYVFAGLAGPGVYVSANGGQTWKDISAGITPYSTPTLGFAFDKNSDLVYAATYGQGLYAMVSYTDVSWSPTGFLSLPSGSVSPGPQRPGYVTAVIFVGNTLYMSTDTQGLYRVATNIEPSLTAVPGAPAKIQTLAASGNRLYIGGRESGISTWDSAGTWTAGGSSPVFTAVAGTGAQRINTLAIDTSSRAIAYAGTATGAYRKDPSATEFARSVSGLAANPVTALAVDPQVPSTIYVALQDAGLYRSVDGATTFSAVDLGSKAAITAIAIDKQDRGSIWVGTATTVYRSVNGGASFTNDPVPCSVSALAGSASAAGTIYAGCAYQVAGNLGVFVETTATPWMAAATGLPSPFLVDALVVHPSDPTTVWAGLAAGGVYRTNDGGALWTNVSTGLGSLRVGALAAVAGASAPTLFAATADQGVWRATTGDAGMPWTSVSTGLPAAALQGTSLASGPPDTLYLGTQSSGVFRSSDGGAVWSAFSTGLGSLAVTRLDVDPTNPNVAYAGTWDGGLYRTR
jgi:ligand-binding sensor domain-containing protein